MAAALSTAGFVSVPDPVPDVPDPDLPINRVCVFVRPVDPDNRYCLQVDDD